MNEEKKQYSWDEMLEHPSLNRREGFYRRTRWPGIFCYHGVNGTKKFGIDYYADGRKHREMIGTLEQAKEKLAEIHNQVRNGDYIADRKKFTFVDLMKRFKEIREGSGSSYYENTQRYYLPMLADFFGDMKLFKISCYDIERFRKARMEAPKRFGGARSQTTVNRELACLQGLFSKAVTWGMMERNPFDKFKESIFFREDRARIRYLTEDEIHRLVAAAPPYLRNILVGALLTGLRKGDLLGLKWGDVDLEKGILFFNERKKNGRRQTKVLCSDMVSLLQTIRRGKSEYIFNGPIPQKKGEKNYVALPDPDGRPLKDCQRSFRTALRKAGISNFRFHDLRHTSASYMMMRGASLQATQQHLGHSNVSMTMRYSHLSDAALREGIDKLSGLIGEARA